MTNGDVVLLGGPTAAPLVASVLASLEANGQTAEVTEIEVAHTKLTQIVVIGKRAGEGQIAADVKARRAK